ncbi:MAG: hypothetical protein U1F43_31435 [Myxococcota bacterium]
MSWLTSCSASQSAQSHGHSGSLTNTAGGFTGSATATCSQGSWGTTSTTCTQIIAGACGSANGGSTTAAPSTGLCSAGTPTAVSGTGPFTWSCTGQGGGGTAGCSSNKSCATQTLTWNIGCSASQATQAHNYSGTITNTLAGYSGSAIASCAQGTWSTTTGTCVESCTPGSTRSCGLCHCGSLQQTCNASGQWGSCQSGPDCQPAGQNCR